MPCRVGAAARCWAVAAPAGPSPPRVAERPEADVVVIGSELGGLCSGFQSRGPQANPLAQVLDVLGESVPCASHDSWMVHVPEGQFFFFFNVEGQFESRIGPTDFLKVQLTSRTYHSLGY